MKKLQYLICNYVEYINMKEVKLKVNIVHQ